jgi:ribosome recycling factor
MTPLQVLYKDAEDRNKKALENLKREFSEVRGGRATPALVEHIMVDYYGAPTPMKQLAAITVPEARLLVIQPWDAKAAPDIDKAIQKAQIGLTPIVDGKIIRVPIPALSGERRQDLVKLIHKMAEESRVTVRTIRRDAIEHVKKLKVDNKATEDDVKESQQHVQKITDGYIAQIDALVKAKDQELQNA